MERDILLIGKGNTAEIYQWEENKILKLYYNYMPKEAADWEYNITKQLSDRYTFLPKAYEKVQKEDRYGAVYEKIAGKAMLGELFGNLKEYKYYCRTLAGIHKDIQRNIDFEFISVKDKLRGDIARAEHLTEAEKTLVNNYMDGLPEGNRLCHFDFHPDNVILTDKGPITIDWMTACKSEPVADAARTFIMLKYSDIPEPNPFKKKLISFFQGRIAASYLKEYLKITRYHMEDLKIWELPVAAARLSERRPESEAKILARLIRRRLRD